MFRTHTSSNRSLCQWSLNKNPHAQATHRLSWSLVGLRHVLSLLRLLPELLLLLRVLFGRRSLSAFLKRGREQRV